MSTKSNVIFISIASLLFATAVVGVLVYEKSTIPAPTVVKKYKTNAVYSNDDLVDGNIYSFDIVKYSQMSMEPLYFKLMRTNRRQYTINDANNESEFISVGIKKVGAGKYGHKDIEIKRVILNEEFTTLFSARTTDFIDPTKNDYYLNVFGTQYIDVVYSSIYSLSTDNVFECFSFSEYNEYERI